MRKEDCKEGLEVMFNNSLSNEDIGVIVKVDDSIFTYSGRYVWVKDDNGLLCVKPESIEPFAKPNTDLKFSITEINAILDEIESDCDNSFKEEWYTTDRTFTAHGLDKVREYLKDKFKKPDLKKQALAKLTSEEIKALGIKL